MTSLPLRWLFLDLNSYFASVEQELRPELRGRPLAIVPVTARTTCCIAVSYEARRFGIRTGLSVERARALCPELELVEARPRLYVEMHHRILAAIERVLPVHAVLSCDEFTSSLAGSQRDLQHAEQLAAEVKQSIHRHAGSTLRCSVGLGPNRLLAKIATERVKPDGLVAITSRNLTETLFALSLAEIPGVGERMERRLHAAGISTVRDLWQLSRPRLGAVWGSVLGERLWLELRGEDLPDAPAPPYQHSISRQHILPPEQRTRESARKTALKMLQDCARRLRKRGLWAGGLGIGVFYLRHDHAFEAHRRIPPCNDDLSLQQYLLPLWEGSPNHTASGLYVFLSDLQPPPAPSLFPSPHSTARLALMQAMDHVQRRFGHNAVYLASTHGAQDFAPTRISFGPPPPLDEFPPRALTQRSYAKPRRALLDLK